MYLSFNVIKYYIKFERLTKLKKNTEKDNTIFILIDFYIKLYKGFLFNLLE